MAMTSERVETDELRMWTDAILDRHPAVGVAVGIVRRGHPDFFHARGLADVVSRTPVDADTVFRIGSITKPITAIAVMQQHERGLIDLDAAAADYLCAYDLVPAHAGLRPPTVRHLLTHTAGIPEVRHLTDLLHPEAGPFGGRPPIRSVPYGASLPPLAEHFRRGLAVVAQPGAEFAYSNHGYATLGQIVEDVSETSLDTYFRERIFEPLGLVDSGLIRSGRLVSKLATGYVIGRHGVRPVPDRDWIGAGCGGVYTTARDLARLAAALLGGGANEYGRVLRPETLSTMFEPHYQPDPRLPGWGLGFARAEAGGHRLIGHDGILPGFNATVLAAPDDGLAVLALTNGAPGAFGWMATELNGLMRRLLGLPGDVIRTDVPDRPEIWGELCGHYRLPPRISDLRGRMAIPFGAEVLVRGGQLTIRASSPVPVLRRGLRLHSDDLADPYVFRADLSEFGQGTFRVVFGGGVLHADLGGQPISLYRRPGGALARARLAALLRARIELR